MNKTCDFFVIGGGSGGVRASRIASKLGANVIIAEGGKLGGTCVNVGCIPKKLFLYSSSLNKNINLYKRYGLDVNINKIKWSDFILNINNEIKRLNNVYRSILIKNKVTVLDGWASIKPGNLVEVNGQQFKPKYILLAVGGNPNRLNIPGDNLAITSNEVFNLPKLPSKILIVGGGYIATELASIFNNFGVDITISYHGDLFLKSFDIDLRNLVKESLIKNSIDICWNSSLIKLEKNNNKIQAYFNNNLKKEFDTVVYAIGRSPNISKLGLNNTNIKFKSNSQIIVDNNFETNQSGIFAVGDISSSIALTPVAIREGALLAKYLFNNEKIEFDYNLVPSAVFTDPNIATVGLTEEQAKNQKIEIKIFRSKFKPMRTSFGYDDTEYFIKLIIDKNNDQILGVHLFGDDSAEIIQGFAVAMAAKATLNDLKSLVGIHPTTAEEIITIN